MDTSYGYHGSISIYPLQVYVPHLARKINSSTLSLVALLEQSWKMHGSRSNGEIHRMWICCVLSGKEILSKLLVLQNLLSHLSTENMEATASNCKQPQV